MSLHVGSVKRKSGEVYYRIRYWDKDKHKTVPASEHPKFKSKEEALDFCNKQNAKLDAERHLEKFARGMDALLYKKKYAAMDEDVEEFFDWYKEEAPNSWEANKSWLTYYVVPYFVGKQLNNYNLWHTEFESLRRWLEKDATLQSGKKMSFASMGHVIKALNAFIKFLGLHGKMDAVIAQVKCRGIKRSKMRRRGVEDLILEAEYRMLKTALTTSRQFFIVLMNTGMRIHELYSLQFSNVFKGKKDLDEFLVKPYEELGLTIYGYIRLESQMKVKYAFRNPKTGTIARKPLKSRPRISPEFNRVIPITNEEAWTILVENRRRAMAEWEKQIHTSANVDDYLLFNVDVNEIRRDLKKYTTKTPHCTRHTFTTNTVRSFRKVNYGTELIKGITGHTSKEFERYVHLGLESENKEKKREVESF